MSVIHRIKYAGNANVLPLRCQHQLTITIRQQHECSKSGNLIGAGFARFQLFKIIQGCFRNAD